MKPPAPPRPRSSEAGGAGHPGAERPTRAVIGPGRRSAQVAQVGQTRSPVVSTRLAERVQMQRRLVRRKVGRTVAVLLAVVGVGWVTFFSHVFALDLDEVVVTGEDGVVDTDQVRDVVAEHAGVPLPRLDTVALRRGVLDVPGVRAAEVTRSWPRGLRVAVLARQPVAAVERDGQFLLLDVEGVQVGRVDEVPGGLSLVDVPADDPDARATRAVLAVLLSLPTELAAEVVEASARSQDTVRLVLADGAVVEWGSAEQLALKARVLQTLRDSEVAGSVSVYDVSAPTMPITRS